MKLKTSHSFLILTLLFIAGCTSTYQIQNDNLAHLYKKAKSQIYPEYKIYHVNDEVSRVYFGFNTKDLLYVKDMKSNNFVSRISVGYKLYTSFQSNELLDSASYLLTDTTTEEEIKRLTGSLDIKVGRGSMYMLKLTVRDIHKGYNEDRYIILNKKDRLGEQNFLARDVLTGEVLLSRYLAKGKMVKLEFNDSTVAAVQGLYYDRNFRMPPPPFAAYSHKAFNYDSDSTFLYHLGDTFSVLGDGIYHFQTEPDEQVGFSLVHINDHFPKVRTVRNMLTPMRFIMSRKDYEYLNSTTNPRMAMERFWIGITGDQNKARDLIGSYYGRVENANFYFSSHVEGWKTDRGMIYMIFGEPNVIYKNNTSETWIYGEENNQLSMNFVFIKMLNPFSENHFVLNRSPIYKNTWYRAVDEWRAGRVYNL